ncbi:TPA: hypothetical protein ACKFUC_002529 [Citrobacter farmeri]
MPDGANAYPAYKVLPGCRMALRLSGLQGVAGMPDGANAYPAYTMLPGCRMALMLIRPTSIFRISRTDRRPDKAITPPSGNIPTRCSIFHAIRFIVS